MSVAGSPALTLVSIRRAVDSARTRTAFAQHLVDDGQLGGRGEDAGRTSDPAERVGVVV